MRFFSFAASRALFLVWASLWLGVSAVAGAEPALTADFDGDGRHDRVTLDNHEPSLLHVWLSTTGHTFTIRNTAPVLGIVARDLDGDHRAELIGRDSDSSLHVWTKKRHGFRAVRPSRVVPGTLAPPLPRRWDDGPTSDSSAIPGDGAPMVGLVLSAVLPGPSRGLVSSPPVLSRAAWVVRALAPLAPRPPPLSL